MSGWVLTIIHGIVEGITEFIPISSTGHLLITQYFLNDPRSELFNVGIQSGAVLGVVLVYWRTLLDLA
ncbi:MAG: undecaprenyl-diphosphate phosphatase, partial [Puniceicoccaceae bacterium]